MSKANARRSKLVPVGIFLFGVALFLPGTMFKLAEKASTDTGRLALAILGDSFAACFFVGLACVIIGVLRNRRWRKEHTPEGAAP